MISGGIVGRLEWGVIENFYVDDLDLTHGSSVGALVGKLEGGVVKDSYADGLEDYRGETVCEEVLWGQSRSHEDTSFVINSYVNNSNDCIQVTYNM